jgi:hypothetical protein
MKPLSGIGIFRCGLVAAWALAAPLLPHPALAQPHISPEVERAEFVPTPDTGTWLERIPGRYLFDGVIRHVEIAEYDPRLDYPNGWVHGQKQYLNEWSQPVVGKGDCIAFAEAPGLQCVINVKWPEQWNGQTGRATLGAVSDLSPAMLVAGVNPADQAIRFLMVDFRGLGHPGSLTLKGNTASTRVDCVNLPGLIRCDQKFTIEAREESELIFVTLGTEVRYLRNKTDRKAVLNPVPEDYLPLAGPLPDSFIAGDERPREWVDEFLTVTFSMRREAEAAPGADALTDAPMSLP